MFSEGAAAELNKQQAEASSFFYVSKPSRAEREAGCENLPIKMTQETVNRDPNSAGVRSPRAGAGRGAGSPLLRCAKCGVDGGGGRYVSQCEDGEQHDFEVVGYGEGVHNNHPTVKPIRLMQYLVTLVTSPGGLVLDPFTGSGTTGCGAVTSGCNFIGIELDPDHVTLANARLAHWSVTELSLFDEPEVTNEESACLPL